MASQLSPTYSVHALKYNYSKHICVIARDTILDPGGPSGTQHVTAIYKH